MELKRYWGVDQVEYEGTQITPENIKEIANHFQLEYVEVNMTEDGVEEALFRPGYSIPMHIGDFVVQAVHGSQQAYAVLAGDFSTYYREIEVHPFVPKYIYSTDENYPNPCIFCGNERDQPVPYHRELVADEKIKLPDGGTLIVLHK